MTELAFLKRAKDTAQTREREEELLRTLRASRAEAVRLAGDA